MNARTRNLVLLAAAIGNSLCEEDCPEVAHWSRAAANGQRSWAWNPRANAAWRTDARLRQHGRTRPGII